MNESRDEFRKRLATKGFGREEWYILFDMIDLLKKSLRYLRNFGLYEEFTHSQDFLEKIKDFSGEQHDWIMLLEDNWVCLVRNIGVSNIMGILRDIIFFIKKFELLEHFSLNNEENEQIIIQKALEIWDNCPKIVNFKTS